MVKTQEPKPMAGTRKTLCESIPVVWQGSPKPFAENIKRILVKRMIFFRIITEKVNGACGNPKGAPLFHIDEHNTRIEIVVAVLQFRRKKLWLFAQEEIQDG